MHETLDGTNEVWRAGLPVRRGRGREGEREMRGELRGRGG
jgi:hypothetical protein